MTELKSQTFLYIKLYNNNYYAYSDGTTAIDCTECKNKVSNAPSGVYKISSISQYVYCDQSNDGGGWTILIKVRLGDYIDFKRDWFGYKSFFGDLNKSFWLGLDNMSILTNKGSTEMIVDYEFKSKFYQKKFTHANIANEAQQYLFSSFPPGDLDGLKFSTRDRDNDYYSGNCGYNSNSGLWFYSCYNWKLTGDMNNNNYGQGINFYDTDTSFTQSISYGLMKVRRRDYY